MNNINNKILLSLSCKKAGQPENKCAGKSHTKKSRKITNVILRDSVLCLKSFYSFSSKNLGYSNIF
mgnify:CR=1 FL=1